MSLLAWVFEGFMIELEFFPWVWVFSKRPISKPEFIPKFSFMTIKKMDWNFTISWSFLLLQVVFVLWVFFVMLVLNNLLNGLAVQDIGEIQRDCEVVSAASQVELVAFIESMLLGDPFQVIIVWKYQSVRSDMHTLVPVFTLIFNGDSRFAVPWLG